MRIWNEKLIPKLCRLHLISCWREALGAYKIITENRTDLAYWKHPATQEFVECPFELWKVLRLVRAEMLNRGYHPKPLPAIPDGAVNFNKPKEWQTLEQQIEIIKFKNCLCKL